MGNNKTFFATNLFFLILVCYFTSTSSFFFGTIANHHRNRGLFLGFYPGLRSKIVQFSPDQNSNDGLQIGFYKNSCPQAENIVHEIVNRNKSLAPALIRLYFHDCFVNGCDASILLDSTPTGEEIEKKSPGNIGVKGFEIIDEIKARLEKECPNTVSCADIISFAARDASVVTSMKPYDVPTGRRDGLQSLAKSVFGNLPLPSSNVVQMTDIFTKKGMNKSDLVTLLGVHSIGRAHCFLFENEIHNFNSTHQSSPKLNPTYASLLKVMCPAPKSGAKPDQDRTLPLNILGELKLSNVFYDHVLKGNVVIPADQSLMNDAFTRNLVHKYAIDPLNWANDFSEAMFKLGFVDVLTGQRGEIRKNCRCIN